jgi:hypothetical protein
MSIEIECQYCGTAVFAERSSRKYCSDSCKTLSCRKRKLNRTTITNEQWKDIMEKFKAYEEVHQKLIQALKIKNEKDSAAARLKHQEEMDAQIEEIKEMISHMGETSFEPP